MTIAISGEGRADRARALLEDACGPLASSKYLFESSHFTVRGIIPMLTDFADAEAIFAFEAASLPLEALSASMVAFHADTLCLIWSGEHNAWWRPGCAGYTTFQDDAGRYTLAAAYAATSHCDPSKRIAFERVALAEVRDMANVGRSLIEAIADNTKDGPLKGWIPMDDPAEIVVDLLNMLDEAQSIGPALAAGSRGIGWVAYNPDSGEEYTRDHPVRSGECVEAERIRPSTPQEDVLWQAFQDQFMRAEALATALAATQGEGSFQDRVQPWMLACFGEMIAGNREERNHRFLEESLELVQSCGCTVHEARQLVDYVYGRDVGDPPQEVGGVMVTLAALCLAGGLDMHASAETELARIWTKVEAIRAKQAAKPKYSPLPEHVA